MAEKILLITGANTGLGYEIVRSLCSSSTMYKVILGGRSLEKAQNAVASLNAEFPASAGNLWPVQIDVESDESIASAFEQIKKKYPRVDILVNNAGVYL